jgi:hypothetical protein
MKFPTKKAKPATTDKGLSTNTFRREFIEDIPIRIRNSVRGIDMMLINEALTAISEGNAKINGKKPINRIERFIVIASYFKTARTSLNMLFDGTENIEDNYTINFKCTDQSQHTIILPVKQ